MSASIDFAVHRQTYLRLKNEIEHRGARAKVRRQGDLLHIGYTGPISLKSIDVLESRVRPYRIGAAASLERLETAMLAWAGPVSVSAANWPVWTPPSAVIVAHDNYDRTIEFCSLLARLGVMRMAFLPHQIDLAHEWVECFLERA